MSKTLKIIFTLSILANVVLAGMCVGHAIKRFNHTPWADMKEQLAPETRDKMHAEFTERKARIFEMVNNMRMKKQNLKNIISAENFDPEQFEASVMDMESLNDTMLTGKISFFKKILADLPQGERQKMADFAVNMLAGRGPSRDKHKHYKNGEMHDNGHKMHEGENIRPEDAPPIPGDMPPPENVPSPPSE